MLTRLAVPSLAAVATLCATSSASAQITGHAVEHVPVPYVDRPLTLPKLVLAGELGATFTHLEVELFDRARDESFNGGAVELIGTMGITDDVELEIALLSFVTEQHEFTAMSPRFAESISGADWGVARFGGTVRFFADDFADIGARFRLLVDNNAQIGFNPGLPIRVRYPGVFRLDTGVSLLGMVQTKGDSHRFGIVDLNSAPMGPDAGVPVKIAFNFFEQMYLQLSSGFGALDVTTDDYIFFPLGAQLGGTIPFVGEHVLDLAGGFNFPFFIVPAGNNLEQRLGTEVWQVGLLAKLYLELPR